MPEEKECLYPCSVYDKSEKLIVINDNSTGQNLNASQPPSVISRLVSTKRAVKSVEENTQSNDIYHDNPCWTITDKIRNTRQLLRMLKMINTVPGEDDESGSFETTLDQLVMQPPMIQ